MKRKNIFIACDTSNLSETKKDFTVQLNKFLHVLFQGPLEPLQILILELSHMLQKNLIY